MSEIERTPKWTLITVTYNSSQELQKYWKQRYPQGFSHIIVDNASDDDTVHQAQSQGAEVIQLTSNIGFSRANNLALRGVNSQFVAFVNPDVEINFTEFEILERLLSEEDALIAPQLLNLDLSLQPNGRGLPFLTDKLANRGVTLPGARIDDYLFEHKSQVSETDWVTGAFVAMRTTTAQELGGWDEKYFMYSEDQDLCLRAWNSGRRVLIVTDVRWLHGWKRESNQLKLTPLVREIISSCHFYATYPRLLFPWYRHKVDLGRNHVGQSSAPSSST